MVFSTGIEDKLPLVVVYAETKDGKILVNKEDGGYRLPALRQRGDLNLLKMVYEVLEVKTGYFPLTIGEDYRVYYLEDKSIVLFGCQDCVPIDEKCLRGFKGSVKLVDKGRELGFLGRDWDILGEYLRNREVNGRR